jgi:hypothetical protein
VDSGQHDDDSRRMGSCPGPDPAKTIPAFPADDRIVVCEGRAGTSSNVALILTVSRVPSFVPLIPVARPAGIFLNLRLIAS